MTLIFMNFHLKKKKWTLEKQIADNDDNNGDNDDSHNDIDWINNCLPEYNEIQNRVKYNIINQNMQNNLEDDVMQ